LKASNVLRVFSSVQKRAAAMVAKAAPMAR